LLAQPRSIPEVHCRSRKCTNEQRAPTLTLCSLVSTRTCPHVRIYLRWKGRSYNRTIRATAFCMTGSWKIPFTLPAYQYRLIGVHSAVRCNLIDKHDTLGIVAAGVFWRTVSVWSFFACKTCRHCSLLALHLRSGLLRERCLDFHD
jgi:hypothetical protein